MNKRILILGFCVLIVGFFFFYEIDFFSKENVASYEKNPKSLLKNGKWIHEQDSLAGIYIENETWTFLYEGEELTEDETYQIEISDSLPKYADTNSNPGEFIVLTNKTDTTYFEILNASDSILSLMHFPTGRFHVYYPKQN